MSVSDVALEIEVSLRSAAKQESMGAKPSAVNVSNQTLNVKVDVIIGVVALIKISMK